MPQEHLLQVSPEIAANEMLLKVPWKTTKDCSKEIQHVAILKRSIDARQKAIKINLKSGLFERRTFKENTVRLPEYGNVATAQEVIVIERDLRDCLLPCG
jgi:hypothetical protein